MVLFIIALQVFPVHKSNTHAALGLLQLQLWSQNPTLFQANVLIHTRSCVTPAKKKKTRNTIHIFKALGHSSHLISPPITRKEE